MISLRLAYRAPLHAGALLDFLAPWTIAGIDEVSGGSYRRGLRLPYGWAEVALTPMAGHVAATLRLADVRDLAPAVARCRRLFDLDADPEAVDALLGADPALTESVAKEPGVRVPQAVDGFELAVRAIVGQRVSVAGARTILARLIAATSAPTRPEAAPETPEAIGALPPLGSGVRREPNALRPFPLPEEVLAVPDVAFGMPAARRATIRALAKAVAAGQLNLDPGADRMELMHQLTALPGIGPWTAAYVAMRALGEPDVFLPTDLGVRRGAATLGLPDAPTTLDTYAGRWRPWRSYAVIRLWRTAQ